MRAFDDDRARDRERQRVAWTRAVSHKFECPVFGRAVRTTLPLKTIMHQLLVCLLVRERIGASLTWGNIGSCMGYRARDVEI